MSEGYELADGSLSTDYEIGDEFVLTSEPYKNCIALGDKVKIKCADDDSPFCCKSCGCGDYVAWDYLTPTPETKRKAQARKRKFTINSGDYIDSREFTREECKRFCELAVECGFGRGEWMKYYGKFKRIGVGELRKSIYNTDGERGIADNLIHNITTQFREFLDKEKGMSKFTRDDLLSDLLNGVSVHYENDCDSPYLKAGLFAYSENDRHTVSYLPNLDEDLVSSKSGAKVVKVTDRDGSVLFEREPEKRKVTFELTEEQERDLRKQLGE